jgi:hypothetical protein
MSYDGDHSVVNISFSGIPDIPVKKSAIEEYVKEQLFKYQLRQSKDLNMSNRQKNLQNFEQKVRNVAEHNTWLRSVREYTHDLFKELKTNDAASGDIYISIEDEVGKEVLKMLLFDSNVEPQRIHIVSQQPITNDDILNVLND